MRFPRRYRLDAVDLSVQLVERIDHIDGVRFVEIFALYGADPLVQLVQNCVVKQYCNWADDITMQNPDRILLTE